MLTVLCRDVLRKLGQAKALLASYARIRATAHDPKTSPELANTRQDLDAILDDLTDLDDLDASVSAVEADPARYGLAPEEARRRRGFVDQVRDQVQDLKDASARTYNSSQVRMVPPRLLLRFNCVLTMNSVPS